MVVPAAPYVMCVRRKRLVLRENNEPATSHMRVARGGEGIRAALQTGTVSVVQFAVYIGMDHKPC